MGSVHHAASRLPAPSSGHEVRSHNAGVIFRTEKYDVGYRTTKITQSQAVAMLGVVSPPTTPTRGYGVEPLSTRSRALPIASSSSSRYLPHPRVSLPSSVRRNRGGAAVPPSPLSTMDAAEAFSRMGLGGEPSPTVMPAKQWAIAGVNKFFAERWVDRFNWIS
jgi:hypothetical protein